MGDEKFASLSSGLLARKGAAKPAMRRQGYMNPQGDVSDDLGWNDMGYEPPRPIDNNGMHAGAAVPSAVHRHLDQLAEDFAPRDDGRDPGREGDPAAEDRPDLPGLDGHAGLSAMEEGASQAEPADGPVEEAVETDAGELPADEAPAEPAEVAPDAVIKPELPAPDAPAQVAEVIPMRPAQSETEEEKIPARAKVAFTLRLDKQRHLKLRLASAIENRSAQRLVTEALDDFFKRMPDLDRLAANSSDRK